MNNDAILTSISKIHAYRYAKEKQRGVKLGENEITTTATKFTTAPIQIGAGDFSVEFYGNSFGSNASSGDSFIRYLSGSLSSGNAFNVLANKGENGISIFHFGDTNLSPISYSNPDLNGLFHFIVTRSGTNVKVVVNNKIIGEYATTKICDFSTINFLIANSRYVGLFRIWNYALSADEIATLYNNGDPMGYVVPKAMRGVDPVEITGSNSYTWTGVDSVANVGIITNPNIEYGKFYVVNISVSDYEAGRPYLYIGYSYGIPNANGTYDIIIEHQNTSSNTILLFGGSAGTDRRLTLTVNSITPVGLLAEYLPHNLIATKKGPQIEPLAESFEFNIGDEYYKSVLTQAKYPYDCIYRVDYVVDEWDYQPKPIGSVGFLGIYGATILTPDGQDWSTLEKAKVGESRTLLVKMPGTGAPALYIYGGNYNEAATARHLKVTIKSITPVNNIAAAWLDSAKQLPYSDAYLPPLLQSKGGYDMVANGAPEILFKDPTVVIGDFNNDFNNDFN